MDTPQFSDGQFVNAALINGLVTAAMANIHYIGDTLHTPGLLNPSSLQFTPSNLVVTVAAPSPFAALFGSGALVGAHGIINGADTSSYALDLSSFVPGTGSQTVYILAEYSTVGENEITVVGPPQGHPDFDPNFNPFNFYSLQRDTLSIVGSTTPADNVTTFELARIVLLTGQSIITAGEIDTTHWHYASAVLNPTGVAAGTYTNATITVGIDGRLSAAASAVSFLPGEIKLWPGPNLPAAGTWFYANGQAISRAGNPNLFAEIGTTFGAGDGSTTFNVPDLRGRAPFGMDTMGAGAAGRLTAAASGVDGTTLGASGGNQELQSHTHAITDPHHVHSISDPTHAHSVADPTHAHAVYDPGHVHGIGDPGHAHGVADPGHVHLEYYNSSAFGSSPGPGASGSASGANPGNMNTGGSGTGIGIYASGTGIAIATNYTGIGIYGHATGIGIYSAATGVTVVAAATGISANLAGAGASQNVPPALVLNWIIYGT